MRFSAGLENPGLKPSLRKETLFRWTEVQLPLLKQGAPTKLGVERSAASLPVLTHPLKPDEFSQRHQVHRKSGVAKWTCLGVPWRDLDLLFLFRF